MAKVCSLCKASVDAVPGEACPACQQPFVEISIEERAKLLVAKMRAEMAAKAAAKAAAAVVEPPPPPGEAGNPVVETPPAVDEPVVETAPPAVDEPVVETAPPVVDEPVVETAPPAVDEPVVETAPPAVDEPVVETAPPAVDEPVVDDAPAAEVPPQPAPQPAEDAAKLATASPALPKEFRSERIRLKPVVPKPEPPPPPPDPNLPRERVPLPAFVPLVPGKPAPPPPIAEPKTKAAKVRSTALRASLLFLLLGAIGFGAWQANLLPIPGGVPSATPAAGRASPVPSNPIVAIVSTAKTPTLAASPAASAAIASPVIAPVTPFTTALASPEIAPVTPVPHATTKPVVDPKAEALVSAGAHFDRGEYDEAAIALHAILLDHEDFAEAHAMLGATLARQGDVAGACEEYARYLQLATNGTLVEQVRRASAACPR